MADTIIPLPTHHNFIDLTGHKYGRLTVLSFAGLRNHYTMWSVVCSCGATKDVRGSHLRNRNTLSCGCLGRERVIAAATKHGGFWSSEYGIWSGMKQRCNNTQCKDYPSYGGRGIKLCSRWRKYENFIEDMGARPSMQHSVDRIDVNGDYSADNCRWATSVAQSRNRRTSTRNKTGVTGVCFSGQGRYKAYISVCKKQIALGSFDTLKQAAAARQAAIDRYW